MVPSLARCRRLVLLVGLVALSAVVAPSTPTSAQQLPPMTVWGPVAGVTVDGASWDGWTPAIEVVDAASDTVVVAVEVSEAVWTAYIPASSTSILFRAGTAVSTPLAVAGGTLVERATLILLTSQPTGFSGPVSGVTVDGAPLPTASILEVLDGAQTPVTGADVVLSLQTWSATLPSSSDTATVIFRVGTAVSAPQAVIADTVVPLATLVLTSPPTGFTGPTAGLTVDGYAWADFDWRPDSDFVLTVLDGATAAAVEFDSGDPETATTWSVTVPAETLAVSFALRFYLLLDLVFFDDAVSAPVEVTPHTMTPLAELSLITPSEAVTTQLQVGPTWLFQSVVYTERETISPEALLAHFDPPEAVHSLFAWVGTTCGTPYFCGGTWVGWYNDPTLPAAIQGFSEIPQNTPLLVRLNQNATFTARQDPHPEYYVSYGRGSLVAVPFLERETTPCRIVAGNARWAQMHGSYCSDGAVLSGLRILRFDNATGGWQTWRSDLPLAVQAVANFPTLYPRDLLLVRVDMDPDNSDVLHWEYSQRASDIHMEYYRDFDFIHFGHWGDREGWPFTVR